jgi:hypothetical protein
MIGLTSTGMSYQLRDIHTPYTGATIKVAAY